MGQQSKKIGDMIYAIAHKYSNTASYPVMSGVVVSVDTAKMTCEVELSTDVEGATPGINMNVILECKSGFYHVPQKEAYCLVCEVDGGGKWELLKASAYDRMYMKAGGRFVDITNDALLLNGDGKGGLVMIAELKDNLKTLKDYIKNTLEPAIGAGFTGVGASTSANGANGKSAFDGLTKTQTITFKDMENKNVKHG